MDTQRANQAVTQQDNQVDNLVCSLLVFQQNSRLGNQVGNQPVVLLTSHLVSLRIVQAASHQIIQVVSQQASRLANQ